MPLDLTHNEVADYVDRTGWDPSDARTLAAVEHEVDFGDGLSPQQAKIIADFILSTAESERSALQLDTIELVARWRLRKGQAVGPNGRTVLGVKTLRKAKQIVAPWIDREISRLKAEPRASVSAAEKPQIGQPLRKPASPVDGSNVGPHGNSRSSERQIESRNDAVAGERKDRRVSSTQTGLVDLGKTISDLYDELRRLAAFARGRRKTQRDLRLTFPQLQLWKEIDASESLRRSKSERFFAGRLDSYRRNEFMDFIGNIVGYEGETAYKYLKKYRDLAGLKRKRSPSRAPSKSPSHSRSMPRP